MEHWTGVFFKAAAQFKTIKTPAPTPKRARDVEEVEHIPKRARQDDAGYLANIGIPRALNKENTLLGFVQKDAALPIRDPLIRTTEKQ